MDELVNEMMSDNYVFITLANRWNDLASKSELKLEEHDQVWMFIQPHDHSTPRSFNLLQRIHNSPHTI